MAKSIHLLRTIWQLFLYSAIRQPFPLHGISIVYFYSTFTELVAFTKSFI